MHREKIRNNFVVMLQLITQQRASPDKVAEAVSISNMKMTHLNSLAKTKYSLYKNVEMNMLTS